MDLREFVKETLSEIALGVQDAQDTVKASGTRVNPAGIGVGATPDSYLGLLASGETVFVVDFDVAVTASDSAEGGAGAKVQVLGLFSGKLGGSQTTASESTSRIKFKVPLSLRADPESKAELDARRRRDDEAADSFRAGRAP